MPPRIDLARRQAREVLARFGIDAIEHICVERIALALGAVIQVVKLDGADAQFIRTPTQATILIADRITDYPTRRFSIAHELGHLVLGHPSQLVAGCCRHGASRTPEELEANAFASELLMPSELLGNACDATPIDLDIPHKIAATYNVSILASAIRFTELAKEPCAAVFSKSGKVRWARASASFTHDIPEGQAIEPTSIAHACLEKRMFPERPTDVPGTAWLHASPTARIVEHAIYSDAHETALSMLWIRERDE